MKITCPGCQWSVEVPDDKVPAVGAIATCRKCQTRFPVSREAVDPPMPDFSCPQCGKAQPASNACIYCHIIFSKYAEKQRIRELIPPVSDETPAMQGGGRSKRIALAVIGLLVVAGLFYSTEIVSAGKFFFHIRPTHASHIPRSALTVTRCNIARIFLKTGLKGATHDPVYKKLLEFGAKLYPRFDELLANPVRESGIELAEDAYAFIDSPESNSSGSGVLFGISDKSRFAGFLQRLKAEAPTSEAGVSVLRLEKNGWLCWNGSYALIYSGGRKGMGKQRALAIMALKKEESIVSDPLKKKWLDGKDDCLVSFDLEKIAGQMAQTPFLKGSQYKAETYSGSSMGIAFNFDKGRLDMDARVSGRALLDKIGRAVASPTREFLAGIPTDSYQGFLASRIQLAAVFDDLRQSNPDQYRKLDDFVEKLTQLTMEQIAESFTGEICVVFEGMSRQERSSGNEYPGSRHPSVTISETKLDGTIALGVRPDSRAVMLLHQKLQGSPESAHVRRDGKIYRIDSGNGFYVVADNGYVAISTHKDVALGLAERDKAAQPVMQTALLERAIGANYLLELKLSPLFAALSDRQPGSTSLEQLKNRFEELRIISRLEKEQALTKGELVFSDKSKNSLYQIAEIAVLIGEQKYAERKSKPNLSN